MRSAIFSLAVVWVVCCQVPVQAAMTRDDLIFYGAESMARGRFPQAVEAFSDVLARDPDNPYARGRLALALAGNGQVDKARHTLEAAIAARGDDLFALWTLGCLDLLGDKPQAAAGRFAAMLAADPANARATVGLGLAALAEGRLADGVAQLDKVRQTAAQDPLARHLAGLAYWLLDAPANARQELEAALEFEPQSADTLEVLGLVYRRLGKDDLAKSAWEQALAVDPNRTHARFYLSRLAEDEGLAATLAGKSREARRAYERALAVDPSNMAAAKGLGLPTLNAVTSAPRQGAGTPPPAPAGKGQPSSKTATVPPPGKAGKKQAPAKASPKAAPKGNAGQGDHAAPAPQTGEKPSPPHKPATATSKSTAKDPVPPGESPTDAR